jgi:hypothetical protein
MIRKLVDGKANIKPIMSSLLKPAHAGRVVVNGNRTTSYRELTEVERLFLHSEELPEVPVVDDLLLRRLLAVTADEATGGKLHAPAPAS